jgi:hypothetical protein
MTRSTAPIVPHHHRELPYSRDPIIFWTAFVAVFGILVVVLGLILGQAIAARRAAMMSFVSETYQLASSSSGTASSSAPVLQRPVRVILAR